MSKLPIRTGVDDSVLSAVRDGDGGSTSADGASRDHPTGRHCHDRGLGAVRIPLARADCDDRELDDRYAALLVSGGEYVFRIDDAPMVGWFITIVDESHPTPDGALEWCRINSIDRNNCAAKLITRDQLVDATLVLQ